MPVKPCFLYHQVMSSSFKNSSPCHDEHDDINNHSRKNMEAMKTSDGKKEIGEVG
jgi:hypothetical protein